MTCPGRLLRLVAFLVFVALFTRNAASADSVGGVRVVERQVSGGLQLEIENQNLAAITLTATVTGQNATPNKPMPVLMTCRGRGAFPLVLLRPRNSGESYGYRVRYDWQFGLGGAVHNSNTVYELPFAAGRQFRIVQGYGGTFTHSGNNEHALDFGMPVGTPVHAAREGTVEVVLDRFNRGGTDSSLRDEANLILVRHGDGTYGEYVHLKFKGARVKPGQVVRAGDLLGLSGNTGYSNAPHLHFAVFSPRDGTTRDTFAIRFRTRAGAIVEPVEGMAYLAGGGITNTQNRARPSAPPPQGQGTRARPGGPDAPG